MRFAIAIRTVDRSPRRNYLAQTLQSLQKSGLWSSRIPFELRVFDSGSPDLAFIEEGKAVGPRCDVDIPATRQSPNSNAARALRWAASTSADWVLFLEDDIAVCHRWIESVDAWLKDYCVDYRRLYAFCAAYPRARGKPGAWHYPVTSFYGSQCYAVRRSDALRIAEFSDRNWGHISQGHDMMLRDWSANDWPGIDSFMASAPSFVQHVGRDSSLHPGRFHSYQSFPGADWKYHRRKPCSSIWPLEQHRRRPFSQHLSRALSHMLRTDLPVYDFGCSTGEYLADLAQAGFRVRGFEGTRDIESIALIDSLEQLDLSRPLPLELEPGNCLSLEVVEHLPAEHTDTFLDNVTRYCSDTLIISWAVKGQGGVGHVNEQNAEHVIPQLTRRGFRFCSEESHQLRSAGGKDLQWFQRSLYFFQRLQCNQHLHAMPRVETTLPSVQNLALLTRSEFESACREQCRATYVGDEIVLCRILARLPLYADARDIGITPHLVMDGFWESWITQALARTLQAGWHCVDIGANHGYYSLLMGNCIGPSGRLLAVEPNPPLVSLLARNLEVNGLKRISTVVAKAVADEDGTRLPLVTPDGRRLNATICSHESAPAEAVEVETATLDRLTATWDRVDFVKIDAEGAEEKIWQGMQRTIAQNPAMIILMEFNRGRYADPAAFLRNMIDAGFRLRHIDFDSEVRELTIDECLHRRGEDDWMLYLQR